MPATDRKIAPQLGADASGKYQLAGIQFINALTTHSELLIATQ